MDHFKKVAQSSWNTIIRIRMQFEHVELQLLFNFKTQSETKILTQMTRKIIKLNRKIYLQFF